MPLPISLFPLPPLGRGLFSLNIAGLNSETETSEFPALILVFTYLLRRG